MAREDKSILTFSTRRLEALTDGIFAIAMTILVLDLKVSDLGQAATSNELWQHLVNNHTGYISFIVSFLLLGSIWAVHMRQFEFITRADRHLVMINTIRLLFVVLVPLSASFASSYSDTVLGRMLLPLNFFIISLVSFWQWEYAVNPKNQFDDGISERQKKYFHIRNKIIVIMAGIVLVASIFIGEYAFILFAFVPYLNESRLAEIKNKKSE